MQMLLHSLLKMSEKKIREIFFSLTDIFQKDNPYAPNKSKRKGILNSIFFLYLNLPPVIMTI